MGNSRGETEQHPGHDGVVFLAAIGGAAVGKVAHECPLLPGGNPSLTYEVGNSRGQIIQMPGHGFGFDTAPPLFAWVTDYPHAVHLQVRKEIPPLLMNWAIREPKSDNIQVRWL